jgi:hypothetical protein
MISRKIILILLLFISLNVFSQTERDVGNITRDSLRDCSFELTEAKDQIDLLQNYIKEIRTPHSEKDLSTLNTGKYYALIITVQDYINEENFPDLKYTIRDGRNLEKVLDENYEFEEIHILENPDKQAILRQLYGLQEQAKENDNVLIFYAGHGEKWNTLKTKQGYWCPKDAEYGNPMTLMNNSDIILYLQLIPAKNILLISDACFAGAIGDDRAVRPTPSRVIQEIYNIPSCQYISSGSNTTVPDESTFIINLLEALKDNTEKYLSASDLFFKNGVKESYTKSNGETVIPNFSTLEESGHKKGGDFIFIKKIK